MKICPQCNKQYNDDDLFCAEDGNSLIEEGEEQETVTIPRFGFKPASARDQPPPPDPQPEPAPVYGDTITFKPPVFKTPESGNRPTDRPNRTGIFVFAAGAIILALVLIGVYGLGSGPKGDNTNSDSKPTFTPTAKALNLPGTFDRQYSGTIAGQTLTMNLIKNGGSLTGTASTTKTDTLSGTIQDNGDFSVDAIPIGKSATGIFSGRIYDDGSIKGKWTDRQGGKESPFQVQQKP